MSEKAEIHCCVRVVQQQTYWVNVKVPADTPDIEAAARKGAAAHFAYVDYPGLVEPEKWVVRVVEPETEPVINPGWDETST